MQLVASLGNNDREVLDKQGEVIITIENPFDFNKEKNDLLIDIERLNQ